MIHRASFRNFRGFENLELSEMMNITLISGRNNTGKSSILDGVFLTLDYKAAESFALLNEVRNISYNVKTEDLWDTLFHNHSLTEYVSLNLSFDEYDMNLSYSRDDSFINSAALNNASVIIKQFISSSPQSYSLKYSFNIFRKKSPASISGR